MAAGRHSEDRCPGARDDARIRDLDRALAAEPESAAALYELARALSVAGEMARAKQLFWDLLEREPDEPAHYVELARMCYGAGEPDEAAAGLGLALEKGGTPWRVHVLLGGAHLARARFDIAVQHFLRGRALAPSPEELASAVGEFFGDAGMAPRLAALGAAATDPGPEAIDEDDYLDVPDPDFSTAETEAELRGRHDYPSCCYYLAFVHEVRGEISRAVTRLRQALERDPEFVVGAVYLSALLVKSGAVAEAADLLEDLARRYADYADVHVRLGNVRLAEGRSAEARSAYGRARRVNPGLDLPETGEDE